MAIAVAGRVDAHRAGIGDHHAHLADLDHGLGDQFHRREQAVDVIGALDQHLQLAALAPARGQELAGVLEAVVEGRGLGRLLADGRGDDLAGREPRAVVDRHHADLVLGVLDHHRLEAAALLNHFRHLGQQRDLLAIQAEREGAVAGDHDELGEVQRIGALAQDLALRALLAAGGQEASGVLKVHALGIAGQGLVGVQHLAVAREDIADPPLRNGHQRLHMQPVLKRKEKMHAAAQHVGLIAGLAGEGDQAALDRALAAPELFDDRHPVVADVADHAGDKHEHRRAEHDEKRRTDQRSSRR